MGLAHVEGEVLGPPTGFWGKLKSVDGVVAAWHPLVDHCADVAACCQALLERTLLRQRLARTGGLDDLSPVQVARLCALAALHDLGKFNRGFQNKAWPGRRPWAGHLAEFLALLDPACRDRGNRERLQEVLPVGELDGWSEDIDGLFFATISHHGRPAFPEPHHYDLVPECWTPTADLDPFAGIADLVQLVRVWFPGAWLASGDPLPERPAFQHAWSGVLTLADWLGSDARPGFFEFGEAGRDRMPFARERARRRMIELGLDAALLRPALGDRLPGYEKVPSVNKPRPAQARMLDLPLPERGGMVVLEAPTGSGKTEAALVHFLRLYHAGLVDGMYFALPTRVAATQIYERVHATISHAFGDAGPPVVQAVSGYIKVDAVEGVPLAPFDVLWPDDQRERLSVRGWAAETPKRYLAGAIVVGTIDQALLSALKVPHAHLRSSALLRHLLVVDEVHASDLYMARLLEAVLDTHLAAGGHALLMSATLGAATRTRLLAEPGRRGAASCPSPAEATGLGYPTISYRVHDRVGSLAVESPAVEKTVTWELLAALDYPTAVAAMVLARAAAGARVLVVRNTVSGCLALQQELEAAASSATDLLFSCAGVACPHHSRFAKADRALLDLRMHDLFGRERENGGRGVVVVATQTVEQSLDLDADLLISDLCPMDVLLQRVGRLHRHLRPRPAGCEEPRAVVLVPESADLSPLLTEMGNVRGAHGFGTVYESLLSLQATWDTLRSSAQAEVPRDNRRLVEAAVHPETLRDLAARMGAAWRKHEIGLRGTALADSQGAALNLVRRDLGFDDPGVAFPASATDGRIRTRLGWEDRVARFSPPLAGPLGNDVSELKVPHHLFRGTFPAADEELANEVGSMPGGFTFRFGARFRYDRWGLRPEELG